MISAYSDCDIGMFNFHLPNNKGICVGHSLSQLFLLNQRLMKSVEAAQF